MAATRLGSPDRADVVDYSPFAMTEDQFAQFWSAWWWLFVKGFHVVEFAVLFSLLLITLRKTKLSPSVALLLSYLVCTGYAALDEWHQTYVPSRGGRVSDVLIDVSGVNLIAVVLLVRDARRARATGNGNAETSE